MSSTRKGKSGIALASLMRHPRGMSFGSMRTCARMVFATRNPIGSLVGQVGGSMYLDIYAHVLTLLGQNKTCSHAILPSIHRLLILLTMLHLWCLHPAAHLQLSQIPLPWGLVHCSGSSAETGSTVMYDPGSSPVTLGCGTLIRFLSAGVPRP